MMFGASRRLFLVVLLQFSELYCICVPASVGIPASQWLAGAILASEPVANGPNYFLAFFFAAFFGAFLAAAFFLATVHPP